MNKKLASMAAGTALLTGIFATSAQASLPAVKGPVQAPSSSVDQDAAKLTVNKNVCFYNDDSALIAVYPDATTVIEMPPMRVTITPDEKVRYEISGIDLASLAQEDDDAGTASPAPAPSEDELKLVSSVKSLQGMCRDRGFKLKPF